MNPVVHFELPFEDKNRASEFYTKAFGWKLQTMGEDMGNYVVAQTDDTDEKGMLKKSNRINGGLHPKSDNGQHPSFVVAVDDINDGMKKVTEAGGTVIGHPVEIPGIGQYVSFTDTEGNRLSLLQPNPQM